MAVKKIMKNSQNIQINIEIRKRFRGEKNHVFTKKVN